MLEKKIEECQKRKLHGHASDAKLEFNGFVILASIFKSYNNKHFSLNSVKFNLLLRGN